jgi:hypothetical protein
LPYLGSRWTGGATLRELRSRIMTEPWGRCDVSEKGDRDHSHDVRSWLDALTRKEEQKLIERLRQRWFPERGDDRRPKRE